jgi:hypothetical protein
MNYRGSSDMMRTRRARRRRGEHRAHEPRIARLPVDGVTELLEAVAIVCRLEASHVSAG